jgi:hypothetical protein
MKIMKNISSVFLLLMILNDVHAAADGVLTNDKELLVEREPVSVRVLVTFLPGTQPCKAASSWGWGAENTCPQSVIGALEIKVRGKAVYVPLSAFADLGNPRTVRIEPREGKDRFAVILKGGDAATSYSAILVFQGNLLSERIVRSNEFPNDSWERTIYKFNTSDR